MTQLAQILEAISRIPRDEHGTLLVQRSNIDNKIITDLQSAKDGWTIWEIPNDDYMTSVRYVFYNTHIPHVDECGDRELADIVTKTGPLAAVDLQISTIAPYAMLVPYMVRLDGDEVSYDPQRNVSREIEHKMSTLRDIVTSNGIDLMPQELSENVVLGCRTEISEYGDTTIKDLLFGR